jgi:hypothetical protein
MQISQHITWDAVAWPDVTNATQYTIFQVYPNTVTALQNVATNSAQLTYDDAVASAFQIRPSSGALDALTVGPEVMVYTTGYVPCRGWLRQKVRKALADRADSSSTVTITWPDDEINEYITEAIGELNILFPIQASESIMMQPPIVDTTDHTVGVRNYNLPADFYLLNTVEYVTNNGNLHLFLKEKPWRGGESTATSYLGYPKLGILLSPIAGRFYVGHYQVYQNQLQLDFDPPGDGDYVNINYLGRRPIPTNDGDIISVNLEDMELLSLYTQMKCWLRIEVQDARLSRWRGNPDGANRDGLPTVKHWIQIKQLYDQRLNDRRENRPRARRLVRR